MIMSAYENIIPDKRKPQTTHSAAQTSRAVGTPMSSRSPVRAESHEERLQRLSDSAHRGEITFEAAGKTAAANMTDLQREVADRSGLTHEEFMAAYLEFM